MNDETIKNLIWIFPLVIGAIIATINSDSINDTTEKVEAWTRRTQSEVSSRSGWFYGFIINPILWIIVKFSDWTDSFTHRGQKNGVRVAATLYLITIWCFLIYAAFLFAVILIIGAIVIYIVFKIMVNSDDSFKGGYEKGQNIMRSMVKERSNSSEDTRLKEDSSKKSKEGGYFSVRVMRSNNKPASDVGVLVIYSGIVTGSMGEKRTNSDGWVEFHNYYDEAGTIWVHGHDMGEHSLADGKTYSFTI